MSDIKHTPGPWQRFSTSPESVADILKMFSGAQKVLVVGKTTEHPAPSAVALVFIPQHEGDPKQRVDEFFANNALIAAAPELLRENEATIGSLNALIRKIDGAWRLYADDVENVVSELRMAVLNLENTARKAQGGDK